MTELSKRPNQNIDVQLYQGREPGEWYARVVMTATETFKIGPGSIQSVLANVNNLVVNECAYADLMVHGAESLRATSSRRVHLV